MYYHPSEYPVLPYRNIVSLLWFKTLISKCKVESKLFKNMESEQRTNLKNLIPTSNLALFIIFFKK